MVIEFRIRAKDLAIVEKKGKGWIESVADFDSALKVAKLFKKHRKLDLILDSRDSNFLKGCFVEGLVLGERIEILPDGKKLSKGFPLFAKDLIIHDERSNEHWDVIFRNPSGNFCYLYSEDKVVKNRNSKYLKVEEFEKVLPRLRRNLLKEVSRDKGKYDIVALAILVLLETKIRIGSEVYYKRNHHKGLSTLKKKNIKISGDVVIFDFVGKDGVPQKVEKKFPLKIIRELERVLKRKRLGDFIFVDSKGKPLKDSAFESAFERYCGEKFYPHIVRSHFATKESEKFLKRKSISKDDVKEFYLRIAEELGHKKFSKKKKEWEPSCEVTLHHYIRPDLVEKISEMIK